MLTELEQEWWILAVSSSYLILPLTTTNHAQSIDLTRIPSSKQEPTATPRYEYSSREVSPSCLLLQQLRRAYRTFLLHQSHTLSDLYVRLTREKFCDSLDRYWTPFASNWDVLLHGNPAVNIYGGIKLAAGGELGIGVGEEDWGSGEREVLEGLIRNKEGLIDLTVSRFGGEPTIPSDDAVSQPMQWLGGGTRTKPSDGLIFSGAGTLTRPALRDLCHWIEDIYEIGDDAYGVRTNPSSARRKRRRRRAPVEGNDAEEEMQAKDETAKEVEVQSLEADTSSKKPSSSPASTLPDRTRTEPSIPRPIVSAPQEVSSTAVKSTDDSNNVKARSMDQGTYSIAANTLGDPDAWKKYLTLGYGTAWDYRLGFGSSKPAAATPSTKADGPPMAGKSGENSLESASQRSGKSEATATSLVHDLEPIVISKASTKTSTRFCHDQRGGTFIIGLTGDIDAEDEPPEGDIEAGNESESTWSGRLSMRTLYVSLNPSSRPSSDRASSGEDDSMTPTVNTRTPLRNDAQLTKARVVVYTHAPFIYTMLFDHKCPLLTYPSFYHDLHHHLTPLRGPLMRSTAPEIVAASLASSLPQPESSNRGLNYPIYDFVYSPSNLTVRTSIPNIPVPGTAAAEGISSNDGEMNAWTRVEALSVHSRILDTVSETRASKDNSYHDVKRGERERTLKTGRGWWIIWMRVSIAKDAKEFSYDSDEAHSNDTSIHSSQIQVGHTQEARGRRGEEYKEAFLIRRSNEASSAGGRRTSTYRAISNSGGWMQGMGTSALAPFSRFSGSAAQARRVSSGTGAPESGVTGTSGVGTVGGIGVDSKKYIEGLLSLNR